MVDIGKTFKKSHHNRSFLVFISLLCMLVFIISIYMLIRPAQSMINSAECGIAEHMHTDECYTVCNEPEKKFLACEYHNYENTIIHIHDSFCYDEENVLICPLYEVNHEHGKTCYNDNSELICDVIVHQHNDDCFRISDGEDYRILSCGTEGHTHTDACYELVTDLPLPDTADENETEAVSEYNAGENEIETVSEYNAGENEMETVSEYNADESETEVVPENNIDDSPLTFTYQALSVNSDENPAPADTKEPFNLVDTNKLTSVILSYQSADGIWNTIDDLTIGVYPPDKSYRFKFEYEGISTNILISDYDCRLIIPDCIPHWLNAQQESVVIYDSEPVGTINVTDGSAASNYKDIVITFNKDFLEKRKNSNLKGNLYILGDVLFDKLDNQNRGNVKIPLHEEEYIQFEEGNLPEKYGRLDIIKREIGVEGDYIKYELALQSLSSNVDIPNVRVEDIFTGNTSKFVKEYAGVPVESLSGEASDKNPYEIIKFSDGTTDPNPEHGSISYDGKKMIWNVGTLKAGTTRYLIYYVKTDPYYMGSVSRGELVNHAEVFSNTTLKGEADAVFIPRVSVSADKNEVYFEQQLDDYGTGYLTYEIKITGDRKNSYDLVNLRLHDYFVLRDGTGTDVHEAKSTITFDENDSRCEILAESNKKRKVSITHMTELDVENNAVFNFNIDKLSPGETITLTYTVRVDNLYLYLNNGKCSLSNH